MSNVLVVQLPLDTSNITLPPPSERVAEEEVYMEYIEVLEGSGYLPQMDGESLGCDASHCSARSAALILPSLSWPWPLYLWNSV